MQRSMTSAVAARRSIGLGSVSPVRTVATAAARRRAAATTKWPEPTAGSTTVRASSAASGSGVRMASSISGLSASSRTSAMRSEGGVVGAGLLAVVTGGDLEAECTGRGVVAGGSESQQPPLVHSAEFFAVEVAVVDRPWGTCCRVVDLGQSFDGGQETVVG